jgi:hypothetical protein
MSYILIDYCTIHGAARSCKGLITMFKTQNVIETRLAKLYYFEAAEFENNIEIFILSVVFELQLWHEISLFFN